MIRLEIIIIKKRINFTMQHESKAEVDEINMESQGAASVLEAESDRVIFYPGLASSPSEGQEAMSSSPMSQETVSFPLESQGAGVVNFSPESQTAESDVRIPILTNT